MPSAAVLFQFHGTIQSSLQGTYDPTTGAVRLEGDAQLDWTVHFIACGDSPVKTKIKKQITKET